MVCDEDMQFIAGIDSFRGIREKTNFIGFGSMDARSCFNEFAKELF